MMSTTMMTTSMMTTTGITGTEIRTTSPRTPLRTEISPYSPGSWSGSCSWSFSSSCSASWSPASRSSAARWPARRYDRSVSVEQTSSAGALDQAFIAGLDSSLKAAYDAHGSIVHAVCRKALTPDQADEVTQDVFVTAWRKRDQFDPQRGSLVAWLIGITKNKIIDHLRAERRHADRREPELDELPVESDVDQVADRMLVASALLSLPDRPRQVIQLAYLQDLTHQEIVERTGLPLGTIKSDIRRGLIRIRELLESSHG